MSALNFFTNRIGEKINADRQRSKEHGWEFRERTFDDHNIGDFISAIFSIENAADARLFYDGYLEWMEARDPAFRSHQSAESVAKSNIGWCFGEGMPSEKIRMWVDVCGAAHPVFGTTKPSPQEAFDAGRRAGEAMRKKGGAR